MSLLSSMKYLTALWLPYYFGKIGYEEYAATISFVYLLAGPFASLLFNKVSNIISINEEYLVCIFLMLSVIVLVILGFLLHKNSAMVVYMVMLILLSLCQGGPRLYLVST